MKRQRIKYKNKQVSTYKNYYITQMIWQGTKVGTYILVSIMAPFGSVKKKGKTNNFSFSPILIIDINIIICTLYVCKKCIFNFMFKFV